MVAVGQGVNSQPSLQSVPRRTSTTGSDAPEPFPVEPTEHTAALGSTLEVELDSLPVRGVERAPDPSVHAMDKRRRYAPED